MQSLVLANGIMGARVIRLTDDSAFTEMALDDLSLDRLIEETFLRILSRYPSEEEKGIAEELLKAHFNSRRLENATRKPHHYVSDRRVSWANHLSAEATVIRMEEERRVRQGDTPTARLKPEFRERYEDLIWSLVNSPEFLLVP